MTAGLQLGVIGSLALSVASSVAIVICNKALISTLGFPFATTLTSWHLMVTYCTLHVAQRLHFFEPKAIDGHTVILFGFLNGTSIGLLNLSLGFNSIGFYQDDETGHNTFHCAVGDNLPEQKIQRDYQALSYGLTSWSRHRISYRSRAKSTWVRPFWPRHRHHLCWPNSHKHNTEETEGLLNAASLPICAIPSSNFVCDRPVCGSTPYKPQCLRPQIHHSSCGFHHPILLDCGVCELQYISCDWNNVSSHIPGAWPP
uniref:Uncharacterized protein n=1 Tax=Aegilops tauschii subsp. strangulata TaxID=200361 RepID=A0A453CHC3_AEGTS